MRFENLVACHLLKENHLIEDTKGIDRELRYVRDVDSREADFVVLEDRKPVRFVECKLSGRNPSTPLRYLHRKFPGVPAVQAVATGEVDMSPDSRFEIRDFTPPQSQISNSEFPFVFD
jgi:predicted AAA+ superfamily ATPase